MSERDAPEGALRRLSFSPRVVAFLDVIEHFPPAEVAANLRGTLAAAGDGLELIVIKVPVPGLLYTGASVMSGLGAPAPLRQLYQAGTWPPHFSYFSPTSLRSLLADCGLSVVEAVGDADFEAATLPDRIGARGPLGRVAGLALAAAVHASGRFDSTIVLARPRPRDEPRL